MTVTLVEKRIHLAGSLIALGLLVQVLTLAWTHPLAFLAFVFIGVPTVGAGSLIYLYALVANPSSDGTGK